MAGRAPFTPTMPTGTKRGEEGDYDKSALTTMPQMIPVLRSEWRDVVQRALQTDNGDNWKGNSPDDSNGNDDSSE
jgi:hypothetical protein